MFTTLSAEFTGVTAPNHYDDPEMWGRRFREFSLGAIGTGVAIGDYDADGWPDVYVVTKTGTNRLYRNRGELRFEEVTESAGVGGPAGVWKQLERKASAKKLNLHQAMRAALLQWLRRAS